MSERSSDTQQGFRPSTDERTCPLGDLDSAMVPAGSVSGRQVVTAAGVKESAIMNARLRTFAASLITLALANGTLGCASSADSRSSDGRPNCSQLLDAAISYERTGRGDADSVMQALADNCSNEYDIAVDYISNRVPGPGSGSSCDELRAFGNREEAVTLLEQEGTCTSRGNRPGMGQQWPEGGLGWDEASDHVGTVQRVCGPLMSGRETADGTFVNIGEDYPSPDRFTFVLWDTYIDPIEPGTTVCGSGKIRLYKGVAQMDVRDASALELWSYDG